MMTATKPVVSLFVAKSHPEHWIVLDPAGDFWLLPPRDKPWDNRLPFHPTEDSELEAVPGHYKYLLDLPF